MRSNRVLKFAIACTLASVASSAIAQEKSAQPSFEVIVTAQKREQNLQDVPVVVTTVSEQLLHDTGVKDIKDLTVLTPGLLVTSSSSEASTTARIRGIGTVGDNPGLESSVGIVIDGVYRPRNSVSFGDLGEMERIEVLKGPQGTLFGKSTTAGVINVVSKKPSFEPSSRTEVTAGNYGAFEVSTSLNGGLIGDTVAGRLYAAIRQRDGLLDIDTGGSPFRYEDDDGNRDYFTIRGQLLFNLSDTVNLRFVADMTERDEYCCGAVQVVHGSAGVVSVIDALAPGPGVVRGTPPATPRDGVVLEADPYGRLAFANRGTASDIDEKGVSIEVNADLGDSVLTSITAWRDWKYTRGQDSDYTTADLLYRNYDGNAFTRFQQFSEEIRLSGQTGRVNWLGGVFYAKERLDAGDSLVPGTQLFAYANAIAGGLPGSVTSPMTGANIDKYSQVSETFAIFTNDSIEITDGLELTVGGRYSTESKKLDSYYWNANSTARTTCQQLRAAVGSIGVGAWSPAYGYGCLSAWDPKFDSLNMTESLEESKLTGTGKLAYRINDAIMTYVSYARGFKASGFNLDRVRKPGTTTIASSPAVIALYQSLVDPVPATDKSFKPETVDSYEVGTKLSFLDSALYVNLAAFSQTYENFQYNTFTGLQFEVRTLEEVKSSGIDADVLYRTNFGLGLQAGVTYSHTDVIEAGAAAAGVFSDLRESNQLPFAPVWSGSASVSYKTTLGPFAVGGNIGAKYNSEYNTGSNLDPRKLQEAYTLLNARLSFGSEDETWAIELWSQNLTDEEYAQVMFDATFQGGSGTKNPVTGAIQVPTSTIDAFLGAPATYGVTAILKF
jgi:iron complex outermembrane receptor protein